MRRRSVMPDIDENVLVIAHPSCSTDELAAPWIHISGVVAGLREAGHQVVLVRFPRLEGIFAAPARRRANAVLRCLAQLVLPFVVFGACLRRRGHLYIRHYYDLSPAYILLWLVRRPFAVEVNATLYEETHGLVAAPRLVLRVARAVEYAALRRADALFAVSGVLRDKLVSRGCEPGSVFVVHNGVSGDWPASAEQMQRTSGILFVGNFKAWHRVDLLIDAVALAGDALNDEVLLVGSGDTSAVEELVGRRGLASRVRFLGRRSRGEIRKIMREARVLVLPSTEGYGSPMKLFEYLASGRPSVLPDLPNIREIVEHERHALLFEPGSADALARCLVRLSAGPDLGDRLGEEARSLVFREYTWKRSAERILPVIAAASARRSGKNVAEAR